MTERNRTPLIKAGGKLKISLFGQGGIKSCKTPNIVIWVEENVDIYVWSLTMSRDQASDSRERSWIISATHIKRKEWRYVAKLKIFA